MRVWEKREDTTWKDGWGRNLEGEEKRRRDPTENT